MPDTLLDIPLDRIDGRKLTLRERVEEANLTDLMGSIQRYGVIEPVVVAPPIPGITWSLDAAGLKPAEGWAWTPFRLLCGESPKTAPGNSPTSPLQIHPVNMADEIDFLRRIDIFHLPDEEAARRLSMVSSEVSVARRFNRLPPPIREAVRTGEIDERRALALTRLPREADQARLFRYIRENDPPIDILEEVIDRVRSGEAPHI